MKSIISLILLLGLVNLITTGCATPPVPYNMKPKELKTENYFYKTWTLNKSIKEVQKQLSVYGENCGPHFSITADPLDPKKAKKQITLAGLTDTATVFIMEFSENENGSTTVNSWSNNSIIFKKTHADKMIQAIEDPYKCVGSF